MHYSIGVEYALHCLTYLVDLPNGAHIGIQELATYQGVSETYLSKTFTKLAKAGIVRSLPGVRGGYQLARDPQDISFWDVVEAIEGPSSLFRCTEVRQHCILFKDKEIPADVLGAPCTIRMVMQDAEEQMKTYLKGKTLAWLQEVLKEKIPSERQEAMSRWFQQALMQR
ncbi:MAG: Rrf2 family transcriptional regulator [Firmicutes bacterium]|nr:Rrf2 family transcriptional regulator [Bacillota bacterium]